MTLRLLGQAVVTDRTEWGSPLWLFGMLDDEFHFTLDAAARPHNALCDRYLTKEGDGLTATWGTNTVWLNPPYDRTLPLWMAKAWRAAQEGATVVCLVPVRSEQAWWHEFALQGEIRFIRGRLHYSGSKHSAPFPSAVIVFRPPSVVRRVLDRFRRQFSSLGAP